MFNSLEISTGSFIHTYHIFWTVILNRQQITKLTCMRFFIGNKIGYLNIYFRSVFFSHKINFLIPLLTNINLIATCFQMMVNNIFKNLTNILLLKRNQRMTHSQILKIELFPNFKYFATFNFRSFYTIYKINRFDI